MKTLITSLLLILFFGSSAQTFTKLTDPAISIRTGDWFSAIPVDIDNNYTIDLVLGNNGQNGFFLHSDSLNFSFSNSPNFINQTTNAKSSFWADADNDCDLDVFWAQQGSGNSLFENNGDGTFTENTTSALATDLLRSLSAAWGDYNNDGLVDLYLVRWNTTSSGFSNYLYKNNGNFNFTRIDTGATATPASTSASASWVDYDNDGDLDIYVVNRNNYNNDFYINNGNGTFTRNTTIEITKNGGNSPGCSWGDYNNDGYLDVYVTNVSGQKNHLYKNNGNGSFTRILTGAIVNDQQNTFGAIWADFDNDGYLDLFTANNSNIWPKNNILYKNNGNGTFTKVTSGSPYTELYSTWGSVGADLNEDGFIDILTANWYTSPITIHLNNGNNHGFLHLNLFGTISNRSAIGARVVAKSALGKQTRVITHQTGNEVHDDLSIKMGFASDTIIDSLIVYWPSGDTCTFTNVTPKGFYNIEEGLCAMDTVIKTNFADSSSFLNAYFNNTSRGTINRYHWDFGDGDTSNLINPTHKYASPGKYLVTLTGYDDYCKHRIFKDSIEVCPDTSTLGFVDTHNSLTITFTDTSSSTAYDFSWDFGDSSPIASGAVVNHTYTQAGSYNVCLTLTDSCRTKTLCRTIPVCNDTLLAGFSVTDTSFTRTFSDSSVNATSVLWNFGDGITSTLTNPTHTYTSPGEYIVCQTAIDACTSTTSCDTIEVCTDSLVTAFTPIGNQKTYSFTNQSLNADRYMWDFGDGNFSTSANPAHIYQNYGSYTVCLTSTNDCFTDSSCQTIIICNDTLLPGFGVLTSGYTINFSDSSVYADSIFWDFGDGSTSNTLNPSHIYQNPGTYVVCQTVTNACTSKTKCDTIGVCLDTAKAGFTLGASGQVYSFTDTSLHADTYLWDFGDGNLSTNQNPSHIFPGFGTYKVCLTITNDCYTDSLCQMVNVCSAQGTAAFTFQNSVAPLAIQFLSQSTNTVSHYWDFGDGSFSTNKNPLTVFADPIVYNVCLTITDSCGLQDSTCQAVDLTTFSTEEWMWLNALKVYPNPTRDIVFIESGNQMENEVTVELSTITGQRISRKVYKANEGKIELSLGTLAEGLYILKINTGTEQRIVKINKQ